MNAGSTVHDVHAITLIAEDFPFIPEGMLYVPPTHPWRDNMLHACGHLGLWSVQILGVGVTRFSFCVHHPWLTIEAQAAYRDNHAIGFGLCRTGAHLFLGRFELWTHVHGNKPVQAWRQKVHQKLTVASLHSSAFHDHLHAVLALYDPFDASMVLDHVCAAVCKRTGATLHQVLELFHT
jgi:hypothetical protein